MFSSEHSKSISIRVQPKEPKNPEKFEVKGISGASMVASKQQWLEPDALPLPMTYSTHGPS